MTIRVGRQSLGISQAILLCLLLLVPICIWPWSYDSFELPKIFAVHILLFLAWLALSLRRPSQKPLEFAPLHFPIAAFLLLAVASTAVSSSPWLSLTGTYQRYAGLARLMDCVVLYFLGFELFKTDAHRILALKTVTIAASVVAIYGIGQQLGIDSTWWNFNPESGTAALRFRSFSTLASPSFLGLYLALAMPLAGYLYLKEHDQFSRTIWVSFFLMIVACLVLTYSRAAWVAGVIGLIILCTSLGDTLPRPSNVRGIGRLFGGLANYQRIVVLTGAAVTGTMLLTTVAGHPSPLQRASSATDVSSGSLLVRRNLWTGAARLALSAPWLGYGPDSFRFVFPRFAPANMKQAERYNVSSHNEALDHAIHFGLPGLITYIWLILTIVGVYWRPFRVLDREKAPETMAAFSAGVVGYLVAVQFGFSSIAPSTLWWFLLGCLARCGPTTQLQPPPRPLRLLVRSIPICMAAVWGIVLIPITLWLIADTHFRKAESFFRESHYEAAYREINRTTDLFPHVDFYRVRQGQIYEAQGKDPLYAYEAAITLNPSNASNYAVLAQWLQAHGKKDEALTCWRTVMNLDPQWVQAYNASGLLQYQGGDYKAAIQSFRTAVLVDRTYAIGFNNLGNAYLADAQPAMAIQAYRQACQVQPGWKIPRQNLNLVTQQSHSKR